MTATRLLLQLFKANLGRKKGRLRFRSGRFFKILD